MVEVPDKIYSEKEMLNLWNSNNPDDQKLPRKQRPTLKTTLTTTNPEYFIALSKNKPVGYAGFEDNGSFYATAGIYTTPTERGSGVSYLLNQRRLRILRQKPSIASVNISTFSKSKWIKHWEDQGWKFNLEDVEVPSEIPMGVYQKEIKAYGRQNVGVLDNRLAKWQQQLRR
nr:GNAT family N-acetyltransferase [bacterium]